MNQALIGTHLYLRAVEVNDASHLFIWENNPSNWRISQTEVPFSMHNIHQLIEQFSNPRASGQLRLMMVHKQSQKAVGTIDLYDINFKHGFASVGILIAEEAHRGQGYAEDAMQLCIDYCKEHLDLYNLQCFVHADNTASLGLFRKLNFREVGMRKEWYLYRDARIDEIIFQLCLKNHQKKA
ncbi:MAG: N-acetyltransferase [Flavobacteriia bacterium]|nr:N-acetyltransferase [Flavobacteriia bacterium]NBX38989.1 N-acetyltransferase [Flavobacteriia bacterium]